MISRHSDEQSNAGEGVEVVRNEPHYDEDYGNGKYTEKRIHLNSYECYCYLDVLINFCISLIIEQLSN